MAIKDGPVKKGSFTANNIFIEIQQEALRLHAFKVGEANMYEELLKIDDNRLEDLYKRYNGDINKPVNNLRAQILYRTLSGKTISQEIIDVLKSEIRGNSERDSFRSWDDFSILYPILMKEFSFDIKESLTDVGQKIINAADLQKVAAKPHVVDFNGSRNFGADRVWMAIYNNSHENQEKAVQFFLEINKDGIEISVYDRFNNKKIRGLNLFEDEDMHQKMYNFFRNNRRSIIDDVKTETKTYRKIGVQGRSVYKISYPTALFSEPEEIQQLINKNLVIAQEAAAESDRNSQTEFEVFQNAQAGDFFYLCWGQKENLLIGQFSDGTIEDYESESRKGWKQRSYNFIFQRTSKDSYSGSEEWWTPNHESPISHIPNDEMEQANTQIFRDYFQVEFDTELASEFEGPIAGAGAGQNIPINENLDAKLEVDILAKELAGIIDNLENNKGQMLGIFGSWGRGKTFLYDQVKAILKPPHKDDRLPSDLNYNYTHHTFNAWKYQETQAIWAHLYGTLLDRYCNQMGYWARNWQLFRLNIDRKGWWPFLRVVGGVLFSVASSFGAYFEFTRTGGSSFLAGLLGVVGVGGLSWMRRQYQEHYKSVKQVVQQYTSINDYSSVLGLQAEIQGELLVLVRRWLKDEEDRLLLFVDDLDRCSEKKIVQVIDALRVMLDDKELIKKIIVLVAVDELLLERAIDHKYQDFKITSNDPKDVVKEYMDKLFIGGVKLPKLSEVERAVILEAYAETNNFLEKDVVKNKPGDDGQKENPEGGEPGDGDGSSEGVEFSFDDISKNTSVITSNFSLLEKELEMLKSFAGALSDNVTPRQLRIYMYRYLLAKNVASGFMKNKNEEVQLSDDYCNFLARAIAERSNHGVNSIDYQGDLSLNQIENKTLRDFTPKLIEIVVPY